MCGIAGIVLKNGVPNPELIGQMLSGLRHRGPDGSGRVSRANVTLGHTRLAIIDLKTGAQPITNEYGDTIIANSEIYNYLELRKNLGESKFSTNSDSEVPLVLFERERGEFTAQLRGMYALAILSESNGDVYLSRDSFGIKPLYFTERNTGIYFASEINAIFKGEEKTTVSINTTARDHLLQQQFTPGSSTLIEGVNRVLPGETLRINNGVIMGRQRKQLLPEEGPAVWSEAEALKLVNNALIDSVEKHQRADVSYGLFLSGGVDSSAILACMRELNTAPTEAFSIGFSDANVIDERSHARRVAKAGGANFHSIEFTEDDFWTLLPSIATCLDDPTSDYAVLPTFKLGKFVKEFGLKVVLSGEGGDELFAGYGRYRRLLRPWWLGGRQPRSKGLFDGSGILRSVRKKGVKEKSIGQNRTPLQSAQATDCEDWLPHDLLIKLDRCLMAHSVEGRTPFLDSEVANIAMRLPDKLKIRRGKGKYLLRKWLQIKMPESKPFSRKRGFTVPVSEWIARKANLLGGLLAEQPCITEIAYPEKVKSLFIELERTHDRKLGQMAWSLLFYALWHMHHIDHQKLEGDVFDSFSESN
ncbi:MAG: asparagine synthase (glutamine-hydrolyzing) [Pseudomonadota bacterium]|nr:asparagine synthase (glutamine-hydrolyzing) [Pseudomonadota bacterium]